MTDQAGEGTGDALFGVDELPRGGPGRAERQLEHAVAAAKRSGQLVDEDEAMIGAARVGARALDQAETGRGPKVAYAVAAVLTPYREVLQALGLSVEREATPASGAAEFLQGLAAPSFDPPTP